MLVKEISNKSRNKKLLGIVIDESLSWTQQIDNLCSILSSKLSLLKHISAYVPQNVQKIYNQAYILPILDNVAIHGAQRLVLISKGSLNYKNMLHVILMKKPTL